MGGTNGTHRSMFLMKSKAAATPSMVPRWRTGMAKSVARFLVVVMAVAAIALANPVGTGLAQAQTSPSTDREALVALYNATGGLNWRNNTNWLSGRPLGEWHGVTTDSNGRVVAMDLYSNQLSGEIPAELGSLTNLTELRLHGNHRLTGEIPPELGNLTNLKVLWLFANQLSGEIPPELGNLTDLLVLWLHANQLSGEIRRSWATSPGCKSYGFTPTS